MLCALCLALVPLYPSSLALALPSVADDISEPTETFAEDNGASAAAAAEGAALSETLDATDYDTMESFADTTELQKLQLAVHTAKDALPTVGIFRSLSTKQAIASPVTIAKASALARLRGLNTTAQERFRLTAVGGGWYRITNLSSGYVLSAKTTKGSVKKNARATWAKRGKGKEKQWRLRRISSGVYRIQNRANSSLYLTIKSGSLVLAKKTGSKRQQFQLLAPTPSIPNGTYAIRVHSDASKVLTTASASKKSGANVKLSSNHGYANQMWSISYEKSSGYYRVKNRNSGMFLELKAAKSGAVNVRQATKSSSPYQKWLILPAANDQGYTLRNAATGAALDTADGTSSGTNVLAKPFKRNSGTQCWSIRSAAVANSSRNCLTPLNIIDQEGTNEAFHPKVVSFPEPWNGYRFWMAFTPYPKSNATYEDPYLMASNDLVNWETPEGLRNPIHDTRDDGVYDTHNSDTHLLYNPETDELEVFWRWIDADRTIIYRSCTADGTTMGDRQVFFYDSDRSNGECISPAIVLENGVYRMWYLLDDKGHVRYRTSSDGITWSQAKAVSFPFPCTQMKVWHLDVEKTSKGYEALLSAYDQWENRNEMRLWHSASPNGTGNWSKPTVILKPTTGSSRWDQRGIYRSSLSVINGSYVVFYGGTSSDYHHGIGLVYGSSLSNLQRPNVDFSDPAQAGEFSRKLCTALGL